MKWSLAFILFHATLYNSWSFNKVVSADHSENVGIITKQWSGLAKEYFTDADNFGITCELVTR